MFENINFLNEGEQADAYKARKAKEEADRKKKENDRFNHRYDNDDMDKYEPGVGRGNQQNKYAAKYDKHGEKYEKGLEKAFEGKEENEENEKKLAYAMDASIRHIRRHHKNESSIFESVIFLNEDSDWLKDHEAKLKNATERVRNAANGATESINRAKESNARMKDAEQQLFRSAEKCRDAAKDFVSRCKDDKELDDLRKEMLAILR